MRAKSGRRIDDAGLLDVTKPADVTALADRLAAEKPIDILVNNAGIALSGVGGEDTEDERWLKVIDVDLNGVFLVLPRSSAATCWRRRAARDRQHRLDVGLHLEQAAEAGLLQRRQGRRAPFDPVARRRGRARRAR